MEQEQPPEDAQYSAERFNVPTSTMPLRRSATFVTIYANSVYSVTQPWDFSLIFGQTIADNPRDVYIEQRASVTLSPQTAKALADILIRNLREYEAQFGEIQYNPRSSQTTQPTS